MALSFRFLPWSPVVALAGLGLLLPLTAAAAPQAMHFAVTAAARIEAARPTKNLAGSPLRVSGKGRHAVEALVRFDLKDLPRTTTKVEVQVYVVAAPAKLPQVVQTDEQWDEATVTWATQPESLVQVVGDPQPIRKGQWLELEVTPVVQRAGTYSFAIRQPAGGALEFAGKDDPEHAPRLTVTWDDGSPVDDVAPGVFITTPSSGATVEGIVDIDVEASDESGIVEVALLVDGKRVRTLKEGPYKFTLDTATIRPGKRELRVEAVDGKGNRAHDSLVLIVSHVKAQGSGK